MPKIVKSSVSKLVINMMIYYKKLLEMIACGERSMNLVKAEVRNYYFWLHYLLFQVLCIILI